MKISTAEIILQIEGALRYLGVDLQKIDASKKSIIVETYNGTTFIQKTRSGFKCITYIDNTYNTAVDLCSNVEEIRNVFIERHRENRRIY
jgi:hypothetical protein